MFRQIFGHKLQNPDPELRLQAIAELEVDDARLQEVALRDEDCAVRRAALAKLTALEALSAAAKAEQDPQTKAAAKQRLADVICAEPASEALGPAHEESLGLLAEEAALLEQVLTQASDSSLRTAALGRITNEAVLARVASTDPMGQIRSAALDRVQDESLLEEIARSARNRDKGVARLARERADAARLARERAEAVDRLCVEIERLASSPLDAVDGAAYVKLDQEWEQWAGAVEGDFPPSRARYLQARERIQARLTGRADARRRSEEILSLLGAATADPASDIDLTSLRNEWATLGEMAGPDLDAKAFDAAAERRATAREAWEEDQRRTAALEAWLGEHETASEGLAGDALVQAWNQLKKPSNAAALAPFTARFKALASGAQASIEANSPGGEPGEAESSGEASEGAGKKTQAEPTLDEGEATKRLTQLNKHLDDADAHIAAGELKPATADFDAARSLGEQLGKARGSSAIRKARERLAATGPKLNELRSWRRWSTDRARERLCDEVEQLLTTDQDAAALARTIRGYRESWKKLDKAEGGAAKALWERFNTACTKAYEPCAKHFAAESDQRNENLALKVALVERLEALAASTQWEGEVDWRAIDKTMGQFQREWRAVGPVNRRDNKALMERHDKVRTLFDEHLAPVRERELARRRQVVTNLTSLAEGEDLRGAADQAKRAQAEWTPLIRGPRKVEQALWTDFRAACDRIFERLREQRDVAQGARDVSLKQAQQACDQITSLATELASLGFRAEDRSREDELVRALAEARSTYAAAGEVPRAKEATLKTRYRKACDAFDDARRQRREARQLRGLSALAERAALASQLEQATLAQASDLADLTTAISAQWEALEATQDKGLGAVTARYEQALASARDEGDARGKLGDAVGKNLQEREQLCLELEIATGVDSPDAFKAKRMAFQIDRLQASMSGTDKPSSAEMEGLLRRWYGLGPVPASEHAALDERFTRVSAAAVGAKRR